MLKKWGLLVVFILCVFSMSLAEGQEIIKFGNDIVVKSGETVERIIVVGGSVTINGVVQEDVVAVGGSLYLGRGAKIKGAAVSVGGSVNKHRTASIGGEIVEVSINDFPGIMANIPKMNLPIIFGVFRGITFLGFLALAALLAVLFPVQLGNISVAIEASPGKVALTGLFGLVLIVPGVILLILSIIGIMLLPIYLLVLICFFILGYISLSQLLGKKIAAAFKKQNLPMIAEVLIGIVVLWLVKFLPLFGALVCIITSIMGLGAVLIALKTGISKKPELIEKT